MDKEEAKRTGKQSKESRGGMRPQVSGSPLSSRLVTEKVMRDVHRVMHGREFQSVEESKGHFWGMLEARPYMRARQQLADLLLDAGRVSEAIGHFEALLALNPNDNQGVRDILLGCYLAGDDLDGARRLLRVYDEDAGA